MFMYMIYTKINDIIVFRMSHLMGEVDWNDLPESSSAEKLS